MKPSPWPLAGVLGQHLAEVFPLALLPHFDHAFVQRLQERAPDAVRKVGRQAVLREAVAQGTAGEEGHGAVVVVFDRFAHGPAQTGAVVQVVHHAQRRDRDRLEMLVGVHVAHGHQGAVLGRQRGGVVGQCLHAMLVADPGQELAQHRVARDFIGHVADEMRQLVAGVVALEMGRAVDVVIRVDQPVGVEHHDGVHAQLQAAAADFQMAIDGGLAGALARAGQLAQVHRRHVCDLADQCKFAHDLFPVQYGSSTVESQL